MGTVIGIAVAAILFMIIERKRLRRLLTSWKTQRRGSAGARVTAAAQPRLSPRARALAEFFEIVLADVSAADRAAWITAALADLPAEGDATGMMIASHLGLPGQTRRPRVLLALNSNSASLMRSMAQNVAEGHGITDVFDWACDAPTDNTVIDGLMAFERWLTPRGYTLVYLESGFDVPTTLAVRTSQVQRLLACAEHAGLTVMNGQTYRTSSPGTAVLAAAALRRRDPAQNTRLAGELAAVGFFDGLPDTRARALDRLVRRLGYEGVFKHDWRAFEADDEELADGGVEEFLTRCAPAFERLQVPPLLGQDRFAEDGAQILDLKSGGVGSVMLFSMEDARRQQAGSPATSWDLVAARLIAHMNGHLATLGREDRFYSVYSGNDARVLLLTPAMLAVIESLPQLRPEERPHWRNDTPT